MRTTEHLVLVTSNEPPASPAPELYNGGHLPVASEIAERLPLSFRERIECGLVSNQEMIDYMRSGLPSSPEDTVDPEYVLNSASIMQRFIMQGVMDEQQAGNQRFEAYDLLNRVTEEANAKKATVLKDDPFAGSFDRDEKSMEVNGQQFFPDYRTGIKMVDERDTGLLSFVSVIAHEQGHSLSTAIEVHMAHQRQQKVWEQGIEGPAHVRSYATVGDHLQKDLTKAMTGHRYTDLRIEEERFAEGMSFTGVRSLMKTLGYPEADIQTYLDCISKIDNFASPKGHNQIDVLHLVTSDKGLEDLLPKEAPVTQHNAGNFGYSRPYSTAEVVETLAEAELLSKSPNVLSDQAWYDLVKQGQDPEVVQHIDALRRRRGKLLREEKVAGSTGSTRRTITAAAAAVAGLAIAGGLFGAAMAHSNEKRQEAEITNEQNARYNAEQRAIQKAMDDYLDNGYVVRKVPEPSPVEGTQFVPTNETQNGHSVVKFYTG